MTVYLFFLEFYYNLNNIMIKYVHCLQCKIHFFDS
jgi:hypothetical protein